MNKRFRMQAGDNGVAELLIYDVIGFDYWTGGGVTAVDVARELREARGSYSRLLVRINSPGGDVPDGSAIYNTIMGEGKPVDVKIEGWAASAASVIAMAGDTIEIAANGLIMIHEAWSLTMGNRADHLKTVEVLDRINSSIGNVYAARTGLGKEEVLAMLAAETWLDADEAVAKGFADSITPPKQKPADDDPQVRARWSNVVRLFKTPPDGFEVAPQDPRQVAAMAGGMPLSRGPRPQDPASGHAPSGHPNPNGSRIAAALQSRGQNRWMKF